MADHRGVDRHVRTATTVRLDPTVKRDLLAALASAGWTFQDWCEASATALLADPAAELGRLASTRPPWRPGMPRRTPGG